MEKGKLKRIASETLSIIFGLYFVVAGAGKFFGSNWEQQFSNWGYPDNFYIAIGVVEILGGIAIAVSKLRGHGAAVLAIVMAGACVTHLMHSQTQGVILTIVLFLILAGMVYTRRNTLLPAKK